MKETLDLIKECERIDLLNEGTVSSHVSWVCRVTRIKLEANTTALKGRKIHRQVGLKMEMKPLSSFNDCHNTSATPSHNTFCLNSAQENN